MYKSKSPILQIDQMITAPVDIFSAISGIGKTKVAAMLKDGDLDSVKIGKRTLVVVESYKRYIKRQHDGIRVKARVAVFLALKTGELTKQDCETCGSSTNIHAHHENYAKPLEVKWLCRSCHGRYHATKPRQRR